MLDIRPVHSSESRVAYSALATELQNGKPLIRDAIANAFGESKKYPDITVPALIYSLRACKMESCLHPALALLKIGDPAVLPLVDELKAIFSEMTATSFSKIDARYSDRIGAIRYVLTHTDSLVVDKALVAWIRERLARMPEITSNSWQCSELSRREAGNLDCNRLWPERLVQSLLAQRFERNSESLLPLLHDDDERMQHLAFWAIPGMAATPRSFIDILVAWSFRSETQTYAIFHLGRNSEAAADALSYLASAHPEAEARADAVRVLPPSKASVTILSARIANDPSRRVQLAAVQRLLSYNKDLLADAPTSTIPASLSLLKYDNEYVQQKNLWELIDTLLGYHWDEDRALSDAVGQAVDDTLSNPKRADFFSSGFANVVTRLEFRSPSLVTRILEQARVSLEKKQYWEFAGGIAPLLSKLNSVTPSNVERLFDIALRDEQAHEINYIFGAMPLFPEAKSYFESRLEYLLSVKLAGRVRLLSNSTERYSESKDGEIFIAALLALMKIRNLSDSAGISIIQRLLPNSKDLRGLCKESLLRDFESKEGENGHDELKGWLEQRCKFARTLTISEVNRLKATVRRLGNTPKGKEVFWNKELGGPGMELFLTKLVLNPNYAFGEYAADALSQITADNPDQLARLFVRLSRAPINAKALEDVFRYLPIRPTDSQPLVIGRSGRLAILKIFEQLPASQLDRLSAFNLLAKGNFRAAEVTTLLRTGLRHRAIRRQALFALKLRPDYARTVSADLTKLLFATDLDVRGDAAEVLLLVGTAPKDFEFAAFPLGERAQRKMLTNAQSEESHEIEGYRSYPTSGRVKIELPEFPWPPPAYAHLGLFGRDVSRQDLGRDDQQLDAIYQRLYDALKAVDENFEGGLFSVPGGFAFLVRLEQIDSEGRPLPGLQHFYEGRVGPKTLSEYVADLIVGRPGYFRNLAFVITDRVNFGQGSAGLPTYRSGGTSLPESIGKQLFGSKKAYVLVYSFERVLGGAVRPYSLLSAATHLKASGLLDKLVIETDRTIK